MGQRRGTILKTNGPRVGERPGGVGEGGERKKSERPKVER